MGELYERFIRLKEELEDMGLFAPEYKKPLPGAPKVIGVVLFPDTHLSVDLKTILQSDCKMKVGKRYVGVLTLDSEGIVDEFLCRDPHYTFVETVRPTACKRNPHVYVGKYITVTCRPDGSLHLNFKELPADMRVERYALGVYNEICMALGGLVEEE